MYKSGLQELCHQRLWPAPDYTVSREGPVHDSRFRASVTVNGVNFHAPDVSKSSKEAQSKAAQVAFDHFAASPPSKPSPQAPESQISFKTQLQIYAQKNSVALPKYDAVFLANVTVAGQTFYSQQLFSTLKEAESDAAKVALSSLSLGANPQELATKQGMSLPKYTTVDNGAQQMPIFSSTVEMGGESFVGDSAKTKKQAEMNAAKVAWFKLKDRLSANSERDILSSGCSVHESTKLASSGSKPKDIRNLELPKSPISSSHFKLSHNRENPTKKLVDGILLKDRSSTVVKTTSLPDDQSLHLPKESMDNANVQTKKMAAYNKLDVEVTVNKEVTVEDSISCDGPPSPSPTSDCSNHPVADVFSESPVGKTCSSLLSNRVRVYPCKPDVVLPKGAISLPFSDDTWVAVSLDFSNHEGLSANSERAILSSGCSVHESTKLASSGSKPKDIRNLELPKSPISSSHVKLSHNRENPSEKLVDGILLKDRSSTVVKTTSLPDDQSLHLPKESMDNANVHTKKMAAYNKPDVEVTMNKEVTVEDSISCDGTSSPSPTSDCSNHPVADVFSESPVGKTCSSLLSNRVRVYPCKPDVVLPKGAISLPFSDDTWVAVSLDFSNHEDIHDEVGITAENDSINGGMAPIRLVDQGTQTKEITLNGNDLLNNADVSLHRVDTELIGHSLSENETSSSMESACHDLGIVDVNSAVPMGRGFSSLQHNRVRVHPNKPNMVLPEGAFRLHVSDDKWVALSMDF